MRPRTTASAVCSPASRSPNRFSSASRTASFTSRVRAGSGVSLSKGTIATVLTLGSPPPVNRYRQARRPSVAALAAAAPPRPPHHAPPLRRPRGRPQRRPPIKPQRVRRGDPRLPPPRSALAIITISPPEPDRRLMRRYHRERPGERAVPCDGGQPHRYQRSERMVTAGRRGARANVEKGAKAVKHNPLPIQ